MGNLVWIVCILFVVLLLYGYALNYFLKIEYYEIISDNIREDTTIVLLTDLHGCEFGRENNRLLKRIDGISPSFICIAGDMTVKNGKKTESVLSFLHPLSERYPVYYAPGNHEIRMPEYDDYRHRIKEMGIHYLENQSAGAGNNICIAGLDLPEYWYHKCWHRRMYSAEKTEELLGRCQKGMFTILLAHNPEYFPWYAEWGADLTLSGHIHGGIACLPFLGGVLSPSLRFFPRYDAGQFEQKGKYMVLSRGLGLHHIKFRFFNIPEISVIKIKKC